MQNKGCHIHNKVSRDSAIDLDTFTGITKVHTLYAMHMYMYIQYYDCITYCVQKSTAVDREVKYGV